MSMAAPATTRAVVAELLLRIGKGDPESIAQMYAERGDWKLDWPEAEHGRAAPPMDPPPFQPR